MLITKEIEIDMAHRVPNHKSKCRNLHWHRYKIEVWVDGKVITRRWQSDEWMVIDFWDLKEIIMDVLDKRFDHWAVFYKKDEIVTFIEWFLEFENQDPDKIHLVDFIPTVENLCKYWYGLLEYELNRRSISIHHVKVYETPTSTAIYTVKNKEEEELISIKDIPKGLFPWEASLLEEMRKPKDKKIKIEVDVNNMIKKTMGDMMEGVNENMIRAFSWDTEKLMGLSFKQFMKDMWLDMNDASLKHTPKRVAKMFVNETCRGLYDDLPKITTFPNDKNYWGMVVVDTIKVQSLCEHHFQPFVWSCDIAYIPWDKIIWLSKFARVVDHFSRKPQVQERLTQEIYDFLKEVLWTGNIIVRLNAEHFCMKLRGVEDPCSGTTTCIAGWVFGITWNWMARSEFFDHLKLTKK